MKFVRHSLSVAVLPFSVAVLIPFWLARSNNIRPGIVADAPQALLQIVGVHLLVLGLILFSVSLRGFATDGEGTLAPWDPPRRLVVRGPYRYVRNPMISGVVLVLFGEAFALLSWQHLEWALLFLVINFIYIPLLEEPGLRHRFGNAYLEYSRHVPRLIPRLRPWEPDKDSGMDSAQ